MSEVEAIGVPKSRHEAICKGKGTRGARVVQKDKHDVLQAHLYILNNIDDVLPYIDAHKMLLKSMNPHANEKWLLTKRNKTFLRWFKDKIGQKDSDIEELKWLARRPNFDVITWTGYEINMMSFYTMTEDEKSTMQNSGVTFKAESMHFASLKDNNPLMATLSYFGVIEEILEVDSLKFRVPVFKCKWVDCNTGVHVDDLGFTLVDLTKIAWKKDPFIMAYQEKKDFYVKYPSNERLPVVLQWGTEHDVHPQDDSRIQSIDKSSFSRQLPPSNDENDVDEVHATRHDHNKGIWENILTLPQYKSSIFY